MACAVPKPATVRYAEPDYWEARYQREPALFEWFFGYTALRRILRTYLSKKKPILHMGCGTSNLQEGMARSGYIISNTDISEVVIKQMSQRHAQYSNMTYRVSDCRNMPEFMDCSFGHVLDKGTIDALLCCKQGTENVMRMLLEVYRVLQPGGSFLLVTLGDPTRRLPLLCDARLPWKVSLLLLPKISAANQAYVDGKPINDSTEPVEAQGPFEVINPDTIMDLPPGLQYSNFFFAYVCKKQPLQLPQYHSQKGQLPNGWVAGSKELFQKLQKELGLPEDLLDKGRRKRVMLVPAGQGSTHSMPYMGNSSNASHTSGNSSPQSLTTMLDRCSSGAIPPTPLGDLQSALQLLHGSQNGANGASTPPQQPSAQAGSVCPPALQCEIPPRPQSAPDLVAINEAAAAAAAAAGLAVEQAAAAAAGVAGTGSTLHSPRLQSPRGLPSPSGGAVQQYGFVGPAGPASTGSDVPEAASQESSRFSSPGPVLTVTGAVLSHSIGELGSPGRAGDVLLAPAAGVDTSAAGAAPVSGVGAAEPQRLAVLRLPGDGSRASPTPGSGSAPQALLHSVSSPGWLTPAIQEQPAQAALPAQDHTQTPAALQVFNFAAPAAPFAAAPAGAYSSTGPAGFVVGPAGLEPSPLPPLGRALAVVTSTPSSPATSPLHSSSSTSSQQQQLQPVWPGLQLQTGQVLPQLQGQQAVAISAATAAGMYPHPVAPRGVRVPRLRRFSTEYGALSGSALQMQLEQLRLIQAQHSESAADGLVLHDVAAGDSCGSSAAAAAAVAAAAWGAVRKPRDRRMSNISILSGMSILSSTSIDESGEDLAVDGPGSAYNTGMCSSEPSCQLCLSPSTATEGAGSGAECGVSTLATPTPRSSQGVLSQPGSTPAN